MSYTPQFEKEYEDGWEDFPCEDTLITAHALNMFDGTFEHIEGYLEDHPIAQTTTMPTASEDELGNIYQYVGETTLTFTQGYFYKCVSDEEEEPTYSWQTINVQSGGGGGSDVSITPTLSTGTKIADFEIDGVSGELYAPTGGGGGTNAQWTQTQTSGTKIAEITIDNVSQDVYDSTWSGTHAEYELVKNDLPNGTKIFFTDDEGDFLPISSGAGFHNSIFRGKNLGSSVTNEQWDAIQDGSFDDLFIGDYWVINGVNWRIAHFDYWMKTSSVEVTDHHVVLIPDTALYNAKMNDENATTGGYVSSKMYTTNLADARTAVNSAFSGHVLSHKDMFVNAVNSSGGGTNFSNEDSTVDLMSETMLYGTRMYAPNAMDVLIDKNQFRLFSLCPEFMFLRTINTWLRSVASATQFSNIATNGYASNGNASLEFGVRPYFAIYQPTS